MVLIFNPGKFPRTTTRAEWLKAWRWKRVTERELKKNLNAQIDALAAFGSTMPSRIRLDLIGKIDNPPIMVCPE